MAIKVGRTQFRAIIAKRNYKVQNAGKVYGGIKLTKQDRLGRNNPTIAMNQCAYLQWFNY